MDGWMAAKQTGFLGFLNTEVCMTNTKRKLLKKTADKKTISVYILQIFNHSFWRYRAWRSIISVSRQRQCIRSSALFSHDRFCTLLLLMLGHFSPHGLRGTRQGDDSVKPRLSPSWPPSERTRANAAQPSGLKPQVTGRRCAQGWQGI